MELIDTHCHLTFEQYEGNIAEVLEKSRKAGVTKCITVGTNLTDSINSVILANRYGDIYAATGIHPHDAKSVTDSDMRSIEQLAKEDKVVAIGETGLDYHYNYSPPADQKRVFIEHLKLAKSLDMPVIVHSREAFEDTMEILDENAQGIERIVFHCFGGDAEQAKEVIDRGYYISFTGVVTFKNAESARRAAEVTPVDKLMVETDAPFMSPAPMRKQKTNEPALMVHTAKKLAEIKNISLEVLADQTTKNARTFFSIK